MAVGIYQFGEFNLDCGRSQLFRKGQKLRLERKPVELLILLVTKHGHIVTREEIARCLWDQEVFVDIEHGINTAIRKIRLTLGDSANLPRFVQTLSGSGYRFIATVTMVSPEISDITPIPDPVFEPFSVASTPTCSDFAATPEILAAPAILPAAKRGHRQGSAIPRFALLSAVAALAIASLAGVVALQTSRNSLVTDPKLISSDAVCCAKLSRDGKLMAFASAAGGAGLRIYMQQTAGGDATPITREAEDAIGEDFSPDSTHIVFHSKGAIYIAPTLFGEEKLLAPGGGYPHFSPDGRQILYWSKLSSAMIVSVDTGERFSPRFNKDFVVRRPPEWTPSGDSVLFYGVRRQEPEKRGEYWIASLSSGEVKAFRLPSDSVQEFPFSPVMPEWIRNKDGTDWILYPTTSGDAWKLFRVRAARNGEVTGKPQVIAAGNGVLNYSMSVSEDGRLAYTTIGVQHSIYEIPNDGHQRKSGPTVQLSLPSGGDYRSPSLSRDGKWVAYDTSRGNTNTIRVRDLESGTDRLVDDVGRHPFWGGQTTLSPDATKVAFERDCEQYLWLGNGNPMPCGFLKPASGGYADHICDHCSPQAFSSDGSSLLVQNYDPSGNGPDTIDLVDLRSHTKKLFLGAPDASVYDAFLSWDDRWAVFATVSGQDDQPAILEIAPVRNGMAGAREDWIPITDAKFQNTKPQFSADGNTVYFTSLRDGYLCIWAQRLDPSTKHPLGKPVAYEHFHNVNQQLTWQKTQVGPGLTVAQDKMLISLSENSGRIWMSQVE